MSSRSYGKVQTSFWRHQKIRALGEDARWMAAYLVTSPHSNSIGSYLLPDGYAAGDLQWAQERVTQSLAELFEKGFAQRFVTNADYICVCDHFQWNRPENPNVLKGMLVQFDMLPKDVMRIYALTGILSCGSWVPKHARPRLEQLYGQLSQCFFEHFRKPFENRTEPEPQPQPSKARTSADVGVGSHPDTDSSVNSPRALVDGDAARGSASEPSATPLAVHDHSGRQGGDLLADLRARHKLPAKSRGVR